MLKEVMFSMMKIFEKAAAGMRPLDRGNNQTLLKEALQIAARADVIVAAFG